MSNRKPALRIPPHRRLAGRISAFLTALGDHLFADADAQAHTHGWQITSAYAGLGRRYRDPRIAQLARARAHAGTAHAFEAARADQ